MYKSDINLNLYKIFYEVSKCESISEASNKLYLTQSAVSKAIKKLENDLNVELFYRNNKGVKLTDKGSELLFYVDTAFNSFITAERSLIEDDNLTKGKISIGVPSQIASFYIFEDITKFHKEFSNIEITIISKTTGELLELLERHEIDFIIDTSPINSKIDNLVIKKLIDVKNCFVVNSNSSIDTKGIKNIKDLANYPLVLPIKGTSNRKELDRLFDRNNIALNNVINIHTSEMIVGAIKKDLGIGYIIYDVIKDNLDNNEFKIVDVEENLPTITINLVYVEKYLTAVPIYFIRNYLNIDYNMN